MTTKEQNFILEQYEPSTSDFKSSQDLITYIRAVTGDYFCIGVAGSPDQKGDKLVNLKQKWTAEQTSF